MLRTITQYLRSVTGARCTTRTLGHVEVCRRADGSPVYSVGNSAVVFKIRAESVDRPLQMRCYTRTQAHTAEIYGERLLRDELYVYEEHGGAWCDVVIDEWREGETLAATIRAKHSDREAMARLSDAFDGLAGEMVADDWAHGDLKPENIIVDADYNLRLIDFDAMFLPALAGCAASELGTKAYQHPTRQVDYFDRTIDNYPIALISTALAALAAEGSLYEKYGTDDFLLFNPTEIIGNCSAAYDEVLRLLGTRGDAVHYRIARLLAHTEPELFGLERYIGFRATPFEGNPTADCEEGLWRFTIDGREVLPPLFDAAFDFTEGLAAVRIGQWWHFVDTAARCARNCADCSAIKPFHNGQAVVVRNGRRETISR